VIKFVSDLQQVGVLVVEEAGVPGENHRPWASNWGAFNIVAAKLSYVEKSY
jgi:hypothetical protein